MKPGRALLILPYFGSFGPWLPLYLHGLEQQHTVDLLLLSNAAIPPRLPANVRVAPMTFDEFRRRASAVLSTPVLLHRTRNICDLRPAFGLIFAEFTRAYEYWGFGDEDVLYGDLDRMLAPQLDGTDLISPGMNGKSGHLTLMRNSPRTNALVMSDPAFKQVLVSREHWAYDETSWRHGGEISSFYKIAKDAEARGELSIHQGLPRAVNVPARGRWYEYDGRSLRDDAGRELLYYHWGRMRHRAVRWPTPEEARRGFAFDRYGFYPTEIGSARLAMRRSVGRIREMATDARRQVGDACAALRGRKRPAGWRPSASGSSSSESGSRSEARP